MNVSARMLSGMIIAMALGWAGMARAQEPLPGASVDSLLEYARAHNPQYAAMRMEADAAMERVQPAGALPDPKFRVELRDISKFGSQDPTLLPSRVGSTRYLLMQDVPWFGKRDLKREIADLTAESTKGNATATWVELAARIKSTYAQLYYVYRNEQINREILDLMARLEKIAMARYAGGLAAQQDVIRAQTEQTLLKNELLTLERERRQLQARMNTLLARPVGSPLAEPEHPRPLPASTKLDAAVLEERIRSGNPSLFAEDMRVRSAEKGRDLTYKNRYPDFTFGVSPIQYGNSIREWELMVELNIPLQRESRHSQEREASRMLDAAKARKDATANQLLAELAENLVGIDAARRMEHLAQTSLLPQAELTFKAALAGYETGKVDFATLLDAQRQIRVAKQDVIKAQAEQQGRLADIERLVGEGL